MAAPAISIDDYKGKDYTSLDTRQVKLLLGSVSCMYDDKILAKGINPSDLRKIASQFNSNCKPIDEKVYKKLNRLRKISFNFFEQEDTFSAGSWTDYGDEDWEYTGFLVETNPLKIHEVKFRVLNDGTAYGPHAKSDEDFLESREISSINAFHKYGLELFVNIAGMEDWSKIIASFG